MEGLQVISFFKPPVERNLNVEINQFMDEYLMFCENSKGEWYIVNSKIKVKTNDVAINNNLWLLEKTF